MIFSIPKRLRAYFRYDRANHPILFEGAWETLREVFGAVQPEGKPGAILVVQTAGDSLNHNPHIHGICSDGVFAPGGDFRELGFMESDKLEKLFTHKVLSKLRDADRITDAAIKQILSQRHTGFSVFWGKQVAADDEDSRLFLCRYTDRGPISLEKVSVTDDIVTYETKDDLTHEFSPTEFLARVSVHIPNKWEQTVRYYGAYSARTRGVRRKRVGEQVTVSLSELPERKKASRTWAALIKRVYEVDPLVCPKCGGEMKLIAFIQDSKEITKIMDNLGLPHYRAPPPVAPTVIEPYYDDLEHAA